MLSLKHLCNEIDFNISEIIVFTHKIHHDCCPVLLLLKFTFYCCLNETK